MPRGFATFGIHRTDAKAKPAMSALAAERAASPAFAAVPAPKDLAALDPETAARKHLALALESDALPAFEARSASGSPSEFRCVGTETVRLTGTTMVRFRQEYA